MPCHRREGEAVAPAQTEQSDPQSSGREQRQKRREQRGGSHTRAQRPQARIRLRLVFLCLTIVLLLLCCVVCSGQQHKASGRLAESRFCPVIFRRQHTQESMKSKKDNGNELNMSVSTSLCCFFSCVSSVSCGRTGQSNSFRTVPLAFRCAAQKNRRKGRRRCTTHRRGKGTKGSATRVISAACMLWRDGVVDSVGWSPVAACCCPSPSLHWPSFPLHSPLRRSTAMSQRKLGNYVMLETLGQGGFSKSVGRTHSACPRRLQRGTGVAFLCVPACSMLIPRTPLVCLIPGFVWALMRRPVSAWRSRS
jgi:hypothetical protein